MSQTEEISREFLAGAIELLSELIDKSIEIVSTSISKMPAKEAGSSLGEDVLVLEVAFDSGLEGSHAFVVPNGLAAGLAALMMGEEPSDDAALTEEAKANITDAFSQLAVVIANSLSMNLNTNILAHLKGTSDNLASVLPSIGERDVMVLSQNLAINGFSGKIDYVMPETLGDLAGEQPEVVAKSEESEAQEAAEEPVINLMEHLDGVETMGEVIGIETGAPDAGQQYNEGDSEEVVTQDKDTKKPDFAPLESSQGEEASPNIDLLMDVPLQVTVELGRTKMPIREVLEISEGSIIELNKLAGEPVDFYVNGKLISKGEVVVIDENFGIRITEIISPAERITRL